MKNQIHVCPNCNCSDYSKIFATVERTIVGTIFLGNSCGNCGWSNVKGEENDGDILKIKNIKED